MPFVLLFVGLVMIISGVRKTSGTLVQLVKGDLTGSDNYAYWVLAIILIGSLGYIDSLKPFSRILLTLIIIVLVVHNGGFFDLFNKGLSSATSSATSSGSTTTSTLPQTISF